MSRLETPPDWLRTLYTDLKNGAQLTDDQIIEVFRSQPGMATNALYAAGIMLAEYAAIAGLRPSLSMMVLDQVLYPLSLSGYGATEHVVKWLEYRIGAIDPPVHYPEGIDWIRSVIANPKPIQGILDGFYDSWAQYENQETMKWLAPFLSIPHERVTILRGWDVPQISQNSKLIIVVHNWLAENDEAEETISSYLLNLRAITAYLAQYDTRSEIVVCFLIADAFEHLVENKDESWLGVFTGLDVEKISILWIADGKRVSSVDVDTTEDKIYKNTSNLIHNY